MTRLSKIILYYLIYFKHFYKFIFLHKPLCERYKNSTLNIFGLYICRSCLFLYLGFIISLLFLVTFIKSVHFDKFFLLGLCGCILTFGISYPPIYSKFQRVTKDFIRFYDGIFLAAMFVTCFKLNIYIGFGSIAGFLVLRHLYNKKRTGDRICKNCIELNKETTCPGYIEQKEALLKIEEEYSNIVSKHFIKL